MYAMWMFRPVLLDGTCFRYKKKGRYGHVMNRACGASGDKLVFEVGVGLGKK